VLRAEARLAGLEVASVLASAPQVSAQVPASVTGPGSARVPVSAARAWERVPALALALALALEREQAPALAAPAWERVPALASALESEREQAPALERVPASALEAEPG